MHAPLGKSARSLIKVSYRCEPEKLPDKIMCDYVKADYQKMQQKLDINWEEYLGESKDDIDKMWTKFVCKYEKADIECVPRKVVKTGKKKFSFTLDRKSLAKRKKKYRLWKRFLATKDAKVYKEYCKCRITRNAIKKQEQGIAKKAKYNSTVFWKFINSMTKLRSSIPNLYTTKKPDADKMTTDDHQKANILGEYFSSVFVKEPDWSWILNEEEKPKVKKELRLDITKEIIKEKLQELNVNKSPSPDNLHPRVFKEIASALVNPLFMIFNLTIKHSKIPTAWKIASITAIYKNKGSKHSAENESAYKLNKYCL